MIPTGPFWIIFYRGHQIYRTGFEKTDNQGCREAALNFWRYSLLSVYVSGASDLAAEISRNNICSLKTADASKLNFDSELTG